MQNRNLKKILKTKLKDAKRIAVPGIGSELRGDDAAGMLAAKEINGSPGKYSKVKVFFGATVPENLTGEIKKYRPTHLIIIDSVDLGKKPGTICLLDSDKIEGISFSTHKLPIKVMVDCLIKSINCKPIIIGIQPKSFDFDSDFSKEVIHSIKKLSAMLKLFI